jgi:hypothetical protein
MSAVQAGKKKSHVGEVKKILKPFHAELTAVNKDTFTLENVIGTTQPPLPSLSSLYVCPLTHTLLRAHSQIRSALRLARY